MSVLIKGMKMPKTCTMCWFSPICPVWVKEVSRHKGYDDRLPNCPLVEIPTPHGRLIDADALIMPIERSWQDAGLHGEDYRKIKRWIKNALTIIEAEEGE